MLSALKRPFNVWFPSRAAQETCGLGTFSGVYLPSVLQMLGVILFMRLGWITGHIGLPKMTLIILMASSILFLTGLSMTSIVTNMKVGSGGSYYIICSVEEHGTWYEIFFERNEYKSIKLRR